MKSVLAFLAFVALSQAGIPMSRSLDSRIVNGHDAKVGEVPYQVSLQMRNNNFHFCGGSVLNQNYVITAAHCVQEHNPSDIKIIAGSLDLEDPQSTHLAVKIIVHERYSPSHSWKNDIALIKVSEEFKVSKTLNYVPLPEKGQIVWAHFDAIVSGWGQLREAGPRPKKLQVTKTSIASQDYCRKIQAIYGYAIYTTQICAQEPNVETGPCHGDSGGPLTVNGMLVGILSWTNSCADFDSPSVYTRVSEYIDWIDAHTV